MQWNNLRLEATVNDPTRFKVSRHAQGETTDAPNRRLPLRKGVADIPLRAAVSDAINRRAHEALAAMEDTTLLLEVVGQVTVKKTKGGRRVRGLDLMGKDRAVISALSDPRFDISGMSNVDLRRMVSGEAGWLGLSEKQQSAKMRRMIRFLRDHGILHKCQRQKRYRLSSSGRRLAYGLSAALHASTKKLTKVAAELLAFSFAGLGGEGTNVGVAHNPIEDANLQEDDGGRLPDAPTKQSLRHSSIVEPKDFRCKPFL